MGFRYQNGNYVYLYPNHIKQHTIRNINATEENPVTLVEIRNGGSSYISAGSVDNFMLVEGTYTIDTMPEYEPYGYKIPVKISGKNLLNTQTAEKLWISVSDGSTGTSSVTYTSDYIKVKANTKYIFSYNYSTLANTSSRVYCWYDKDKNFLGGSSYNPTSKQIVINISSDGYLRFSYDLNGVDVQIEEGDTATNYEPYIEPTTTNIYLNDPLRKIYNNTDYIGYKDKKIIRQVGRTTFDGTEEWVLHTTTNEGYGVFRNEGLLTPLIGAPISWTFMTHFALTYEPATANFGVGWYRPTYSSSTGSIAGSRIYISAAQTTVEDFKAWLANNKPSIVYPLATEIEETIEFPKIPTVYGTTILDIETTNKPSEIDIEYWSKL